MSPQRIVQEIQHMQKQYNINAVFFADDVFSLDNNRVMKFSRLMTTMNIPVRWAVQTRVDLLNKRLLKKMKKAGCDCICLGLESGSDRILRLLNKDTTIKQIKRVCAWLHEVNISITAYFIVGNPDERAEDIMFTRELIKKIKPLIIQVAYFTPYTGSSFTNQHPLKTQSSHYEEHNYGIHHLDDLQDLQGRLYQEHYTDPSTMLQYLTKRGRFMISELHKESRLISWVHLR